MEPQWGGHVKIRGVSSWVSDETVYQLTGAGPYIDGSAEGRLKNQLSLGQRFQLETHYEIVLYGGDTRNANQQLATQYPVLSDVLLLSAPVDDATRFFDLTAVLAENDDAILYHRLDRLSLTYQAEWGLVRAGRQAVTWGNGLLFNPMDLFNPFAPTDVDRDYKLGDDLLAAQFSLPGDGDLQLLLVPRRDPSDGSVEADLSSLGGKLHLAWGATEFSFMAAKHYRDDIVGLGSQGYLLDAAWRIDGTYTFLDEQSSSDDYLSLVVNIDYSWVWADKNVYGFIEFFYSGIGEDSYSQAITNPDILKRLARGELFTLGRTYLSGMTSGWSSSVPKKLSGTKRAITGSW